MLLLELNIVVFQNFKFVRLLGRAAVLVQSLYPSFYRRRVMVVEVFDGVIHFLLLLGVFRV